MSVPSADLDEQGPVGRVSEADERRPALAVRSSALAVSGAVSAALFAWLAVATFGGKAPLAFDRTVDPIATRLAGWLPADGLARIDGRWLLLPAAAVWAGLVWLAARRADQRVGRAVAAGPVVALVAGQLVARPVIGRRLDGVFTFPSGVTTAVAALAVAGALLAWWPQGGAGARRRGRAVVSFGAATVVTLGAVAVTAAGPAMVSDAVAGALLGAATVLLTAAVCARFVPADRPVITRPWLRYGLCLVVGAAAALVGSIRLPYFVLSPGSLIPLNSAIVVREPGVGGVETLNGTYSGLTVRSTTLTIGGWAWHELAGSVDEIVPHAAVVPAGQDDAAYRAMERQRFVDASAVAVAVAEQKLGRTVGQLGDGALVTAVEPGSPADGVLVAGDVVTAVGGEAVTNEDGLRQGLIAVTSAAGIDPTPSEAPDERTVPTELTVRAFDGTVRTVPVQLRRLPRSGRFGLGIGVATANLRFDLPIDVTVDGGRVGGPSAGLLTALAVYDTLSEEDLAAGRHIAGTGTLSLAGTVGRIGGIEEKVRAAVNSGATLFLAPADQADAATAAAQGRIEVIGVHTFDEGLAALRQG